jgi:hypothetical protein
MHEKNNLSQNMKIEDIVVNLKKNFLFQASLGSKELFHSNLLALILEQRNHKGEFEVLRIFLNEFLNENMPVITNPEEIIIAREEKKIDLIISIIGLVGLITLSIIAMIDSQATDIVSGVIVQLLFASLFISGYVSYSSKKR